MRLLTFRIHKAFPELDRFSDEQGLRFVQAARRGMTAWGLKTLYAAVFVVTLLAGLWLAALVYAWADDYQRIARGDVWWVEALACGVTLTMLTAGPVVTLLFRDWMLRRRVRWVLKNQSLCPRCGYGLIGLAVSPEHTITCPECGLAVQVDPALGELAKDESGRERYVPAVIQKPEKFWTAARWKKARRGLAAMLLLLVLMAGGNELRARWITHRAHALRLTPADLTAAGEKSVWTGTGASSVVGVEDGGIITARITRIVGEVRDELSRAGALTYEGSYVSPRPLVLAGSAVPRTDAQRDAFDRDLAMRAMRLYQQHGVYAELDRLTQARVFEAEPALVAEMPLMMQLWGGVDFQPLALNPVRMALARASGDDVELLRAYESSMAVSRLLRARGTAAGQAISGSMDGLARTQVRAWLWSHPSRERLADLRAAATRQAAATPLDRVLARERRNMLDVVGWFFEDMNMNRLWGYGSDERLEMIMGPGRSRALGSLAENVRAVNAVFAQASQVAAMPPGPARAAKFPMVVSTGLALPDTLLANVSQTIAINDWQDLERRADETMVALELYYAAFRRYPSELADLLPWYLDEYPFDPVTGGAFLYKSNGMLGPAAGYGLYLAGADGVDNGGVGVARPMLFYPFGRYAELYASTPGADYIITEVEAVGP